MRRIGSNIRKQNADARSNRPTRNIIRYTDDDKPRNDYPKRIISPTKPKSCCNDDNRINVGTVREVDGFKLCYTSASSAATRCASSTRRWSPPAKP